MVRTSNTMILSVNSVYVSSVCIYHQTKLGGLFQSVVYVLFSRQVATSNHLMWYWASKHWMFEIFYL